MKNLKVILILTFFMVSPLFAMMREDIRGPIPGYTNTPYPNNLLFTINYNDGYAIEEYSSIGTLSTFNGMFEGKANPIQSYSDLNLDASFSFHERFGISIFIPYVLSQSYKYRSLSEDLWYLEDLSGKNGLGDIRLGGWYIFRDHTSHRLMFHPAFKLATGSPFDELNYPEFEPTGTGQTSLELNLLGDFKLLENLLLSLKTGYIINFSGDFKTATHSWTEDPGNVINLNGRLSINPLDYLSVGFEVGYHYQDAFKVGGEKTKNTDIHYYLISPLIGFQTHLRSTKISLMGGYYNTFSGKNTLQWNTLNICLLIYL